MKKTCNRCGLPKPTDEFYGDTHAADGLMGCCKACKKAYLAKYRDANREEIRWKDRVRYSESPLRRLQVRASKERVKRSATW